MKTSGRIVSVDIDYISHKHKITLEVDDKELVGLEELRNVPLISITLEKQTKQKSLNANNYAWVLMQEIADKQGITKEEVYREYIKDKGVFRTISIANEAVSTFTHLWQEKGLGWICEPINVGKSMTDLICYYGISVYNSKQMSNLIDHIVYEAKQLGIETMTPEQITKLKEGWEQICSKKGKEK